MSSFKLKEKRFKPRKALTGLLPGPITKIDGERVTCRPVDISENGLGILSEEQLSTGDKLMLELKDEKIALEVTYQKRDFGKHNLFRYGIICTENKDLEKIFLEAGCLK